MVQGSTQTFDLFVEIELYYIKRGGIVWNLWFLTLLSF